MNVRHLAAVAALLGLAGCQGGVAPPPQTTADAVLCASSLAASGSSDPAVLSRLALTLPPCMALSTDAISTAIAQAGSAAAAKAP